MAELSKVYASLYTAKEAVIFESERVRSAKGFLRSRGSRPGSRQYMIGYGTVRIVHTCLVEPGACPLEAQLPVAKDLHVLDSYLRFQVLPLTCLMTSVDPSYWLAYLPFRYEWALLYCLKSSPASSLDRPVLSGLCLSG